MQSFDLLPSIQEHKVISTIPAKSSFKSSNISPTNSLGNANPKKGNKKVKINVQPVRAVSKTENPNTVSMVANFSQLNKIRPVTEEDG